MKTVCDLNMCNGCMACLEKCQRKAITIKKQAIAYNAVIEEKKCVSCNACYSVCPRRNTEALPFAKPIKWHQGWADNNFRGYSTSGGVASAIMTEFIRSGGYVCSCLFLKGDFRFELTNDIKYVQKFAGSKYVKSNPEGVYLKIQKMLQSGNEVLFLGLPCQVAAVKRFISYSLQERLYTIDLICHGTPAPELLRRYLSDHKINIDTIDNISFRAKNDFRARSEFKPIIAPGVADRYLYTFLKRINYTENCYSCQFATIDRISDLTLGDSWGTKLDAVEQKKGISLLLSQSDKGNELIEIAGLQLFDLDLETAIQNNGQLQSSAQMSDLHHRFFELYEKGLNYDKIVFKLAPKVFIKQDIKEVLIKLHIMGGYNIYQISTKNRQY